MTRNPPPVLYCSDCGHRLVRRVYVLWKSRDETSVGVHHNGIVNGVAKTRELDQPYCVYAGCHEADGRARRQAR